MQWNDKKKSPKALSWNEFQRFCYRKGLKPRLVKRIIKHVERDINNCGPEWTCKRWKAIKSSLLSYYAHDFDKTKLCCSYVGSTRGGNWVGLYGDLQHLCHTHTGFVKLMNTLNLTSAFVADDPTQAQINKFRDAVLKDGPPTPPEYLEKLLKAAKDLPEVSFGMGCDVITSPALKETHDSRMLEEWMTWSRTPQGLETITSDWFQPFIQGPENLLNLLGHRGCYQRENIPIGYIRVTQEPGFKLRCYAAPMIWTQICLEPLKKFLMETLKRCPWDMTHNQRFADETIRQRLAHQGYVHCFDLSNATDRIPVDSQIAVLKAIVPKMSQHYIHLFEMVISSEWEFVPTGERLRWHRGQPLGSGPSFGCFALWHGLLLYALNGYSHEDKFFIVGDDVVILDDTLALLYENAINDLKLDYSPQKTMHSNTVAEFTGRLITRYGVYKNPKWRKFTKENFVDNLFNNGPKFLDFVPKQARGAMTIVMSLPEPWGVGFNPSGLTLEERLAGAYHVLISEKKPLGYDLRPSDRAHFRIASLSDKMSERFYPVFASSKFQANLEYQDKLAQAQARLALGEAKSRSILADGSNLAGLLLNEGVKANLPLERSAIKIQKHSKNYEQDSLDNTMRRYQELVEGWQQEIVAYLATCLNSPQQC